MNDIEDYREIIGDEIYYNLFKKARSLSTRKILISILLLREVVLQKY